VLLAQEAFSIAARNSYNGAREAIRGGPTPTLGCRFGVPSSVSAAGGRSENQRRFSKNMNLTNINLDRRQKLRKTPDKFAFIQLERDDGGAVLDVSEAGLRFETFAPVQQNGPVHFWFSLNLRDRIEAWGEVVWTSAAGKSGGLRFLRLSEESRAQIRECLSRPSAQEASDSETLRWKGAPQIPARMGARDADAVARFVSKARPRRPVGFSGTGDAGEASILLPPPEEATVAGELVPTQRHLSEMRRQLILGVLLGAGISGTVAVAAITISHYRDKNEPMAEATVDSSAPASKGTESPSAPVGPAAANGASAGIFGSSNLKKGVAGTRTPSIRATETGGHPRPRSSEAPASDSLAQLPAQPSLGSSASQQKTSQTPQQLWTLVQAGNSSAATALAELYIKGEGVPQNCTQARVLLLVASAKQNARAIKRLAELDKTGCVSPN
jgi:hypothetical protein